MNAKSITKQTNKKNIGKSETLRKLWNVENQENYTEKGNGRPKYLEERPISKGENNGKKSSSYVFMILGAERGWLLRAT